MAEDVVAGADVKRVRLERYIYGALRLDYNPGSHPFIVNCG